MRHLSRPTPFLGESLASLLGRFASANDIPAGHVFGHRAAAELLKSRTLTAADQHDLGEALGLDRRNWDQCQFAPSQISAIGDLRVGSATTDPLGWALTHHSTRCSACHERKAPWMLVHQLGLAWVCVEHEQYLRAVCGRCNPRGGLLAGAAIRCTHHDRGYGREDLSETLVLQSKVFAAVEDASDLASQRWLRDLRAASVFAYVDAALCQRSPYLSKATIRHASGMRERTRQNQGGRVGLRLDRPAHEPWLNAHVVTTASKHVARSTDRFDVDWLAAVAKDIRMSDLPTHRIKPFSDHLDIRIPGSKVAAPIASRWQALARNLAQNLRTSGFRSINIPAALIDPRHEDLWTSEWAVSLTRAALIRRCLANESLSASVRSLGHHFTHVTAVRQLLRGRPSPEDENAFRAAVAGLMQGPASDLETARFRQQHVKNVPESVLRQFRLHPPSSNRLRPGQVAAAWLWCTTTGSHLTSAPFLDGRATHPMALEIRNWHQAEATSLIALLDWNDDANTKAVQGKAAPLRAIESTDERRAG